MQGNKRKAFTTWLVFLIVVAVLSALVWMGYSVLHSGKIVHGPDSVSTNTSLHVGLTDMPQSLDMRTKEGSNLDRIMLGNVYETLVARDNDNKLVPGLAKRWTISKDGLRYSFDLRSGVRFSNGHMLTATDVVWSLQQAVNKQYIGADKLADLAEVTNPDTLTVDITLSKADPMLLRTLSSRVGAVYDQDASVNYARQSAGSGPFAVTKITPGSSITLTRNSHYWSTPAQASSLTLHFYTDEQAMLQDVADGKLDVAFPSADTDTSSVANNPTITVTNGSTTVKTLIAFNADTDSIMSDGRMRQAVRYAIDPNAIVASRNDAAGPLGGPFSPLEPGYEDLTGLFPHDVATGAKLARYFSPGYYNYGLRFVVPQRYESLAQTIAQQIEQANIPVKLEALDDAALQQRLDSRDFDMTIITMADTNDTTQIATPNGLSQYVNGDVQQLYDTLIGATNNDEYIKGLKEYARALSQEAVAGWLYYGKDTIVAANAIEGYNTNMTDQMLTLSALYKK